MVFTDHVYVTVQAGNGGNGCESLNRRTDRKNEPDGGDGGRGGSVIFRADRGAPPLESFKFQRRIAASSGMHGSSNLKRGKNGDDLVVLVPAGTSIYDRKRNFLLRNLRCHGDEVRVAKGGEGGSGNHGGKKAFLGGRGEAVELELIYRIQADIFFVGLPNSGKSAILNLLTGTHTKTEAYPFATQTPQVGVLKISDYEQRVICELPSLYESSHQGRGLGNDFLKHLELARLIVYMIDPVSDFAPSLQSGLSLLMGQLEAYNSNFLKIPSAVAVNKMDLEESEVRVQGQKFEPKIPCFFLSAVSKKGLDAFILFMSAAGNKD